MSSKHGESELTSAAAGGTVESEVRPYFPDLNDDQWRKLARYHELLVEWNGHINLTSIVDRREVYIKHYFDSLMVQKLDLWARVPQSARVADIGTGAGFPGMVLAIAAPEKKFVLFDALNKRIKFLDTVVRELDLSNVDLVHGRAEDVGQSVAYRETFDVVVSRAVARMNVLNEYALPLVRVEGIFIAYKGPAAADEMVEARNSVRKLGGSAVEMAEKQLPLGMGTRFFVCLEKVKATPRLYPRKAGTPQKQPLI